MKISKCIFKLNLVMTWMLSALRLCQIAVIYNKAYFKLRLPSCCFVYGTALLFGCAKFQLQARSQMTHFSIKLSNSELFSTNIICVATFEFSGALSVTSAASSLWYPQLCRKGPCHVHLLKNYLWSDEKRWSIICLLQMMTKGTLERNPGAEKAEEEKARCLRQRILGVKIEFLKIRTNI